MKGITILILVITIFAFNAVNAQTEIATEKQKAIKELVGLITKDNKAEEFVKIMTGQLSMMNEEVVKATLDERTDLTVAERRSMEKILITDSRKYTEQLSERLTQKLDYNGMVNDISAIVYDKYYSLTEINDLIVFYKTPTGQKSLKIMQPLLIETMQLTQERLTPKLILVMQELREEQRHTIAKRVNEMKPPTSKKKGSK